MAFNDFRLIRATMPTAGLVLHSEQSDLLRQILSTVQSIEQHYTRLAATVESVQRQITNLSEARQAHSPVDEYPAPVDEQNSVASLEILNDEHKNTHQAAAESLTSLHPSRLDFLHRSLPDGRPSSPKGRPGAASISRIILTTYPNQSGIDPITLNWGHEDPVQRGPVVVSRNQSTIRRRNGMFFRLALVWQL